LLPDLLSRTEVRITWIACGLLLPSKGWLEGTAVLDLNYLVLYSVQLQKHGLNLDIVVFPNVSQFKPELIDRSVLLFLAFDENDTVVEAFFMEVCFVILPEDFNFAS